MLSALAIATGATLVLAGCAGSAGDGDGGSGDTVTVVASTNVYGQLAAQVGGDRVSVTSIITSDSQDPHSYEATARDQLAVDRAQLVIENGGGYDHFMDVLLEGAGGDPEVITAVEFSHDWPGNEGHDADDDGDGHDDDHAEDDGGGHDDDHADHDDDDHADDHDHDHDHSDHGHVAGFNEHVWYDVHTVAHVVEAIADELAEIDPEGASAFHRNAGQLVQALEGIEVEIAEVANLHAGEGVFLTEPLAGYLAGAAGLKDLAPDGFASAVEGGQDVSPATLLAALRVIEGGEVRAVLTNVQTGGAETQRVEEEADAAGIPIVQFSELLPPDTSYAEWMTDNVARLGAALAP